MPGARDTNGNAESNTASSLPGRPAHLTGTPTVSGKMRMSLPGSSCTRHLPEAVQTSTAPSMSRSHAVSSGFT